MLKIFTVFASISCIATGNKHLEKRALLYPEFAVYQFTYGLTVPLILPSRSLGLSMCLQVNYNLPFNVSQFDQVLLAKAYGRNFDVKRETFYKYIINYLNSMNIAGEECLYRAICEIAEVPLYVDNKNTLLENIAHHMLTPSLSLKSANAAHKFANEGNVTFADKLLMAENIGNLNGNCNVAFPECELSIVDLFTNKFFSK